MSRGGRRRVRRRAVPVPRESLAARPAVWAPPETGMKGPVPSLVILDEVLPVATGELAVGARVRLVSTDDPLGPGLPGDEGVVTVIQQINAVGRIVHVTWDKHREPQVLLPDTGDVVTVVLVKP